MSLFDDDSLVIIMMLFEENKTTQAPIFKRAQLGRLPEEREALKELRIEVPYVEDCFLHSSPYSPG
jgi:hypothetical protein